MAVLSVSRRTDIPTYFSEWFLNRLEAGEVYTRNNLYNPNAVSHITFRKEDIDCIVFWTKNPIPMLNKLDRLRGYRYYFQFTLTGYGEDMEAGLPDKERLIEAFRTLALAQGSNRKVIWRYDPIVFTSTYTMEWHIKTFELIARMLAGFTDRCVISFLNTYDFVRDNMSKGRIFAQNKSKEQLLEFCKQLSEIANRHGMKIYSCAEEISLEEAGIEHGACIDQKYIEERITGYPLKGGKDKGQRTACRCMSSVDFGRYNTCKNGCRYCYACKNTSQIDNLFAQYDEHSPILCDTLKPTDVITERPLKSLRKAEELNQLSFL